MAATWAMPAPMVPAPTTPTGIARSSGATLATLPRSLAGSDSGREDRCATARPAQGPYGCTTIFTTLVVCSFPRPLVRHPLPERGAVMTRLAQTCGHASYPLVAEPE